MNLHSAHYSSYWQQNHNIIFFGLCCYKDVFFSTDECYDTSIGARQNASFTRYVAWTMPEYSVILD